MPDEPRIGAVESLRTSCVGCLVALGMLLVAGGVLGMAMLIWRSRTAEQRAAVAWIEDLGGRTDDWAEVRSDWHVTSVDLGLPCVRDEHLAVLEPLHEVKVLSLDGSSITDDGLAHLSRLPQLACLYLAGTEVTDEGLAHLSEIEPLKELRLCHTRVTDEGLKRLAGLPNLLLISAEGSYVTEEGAFRFKALRPDVRVDASPARGEAARRAAVELTRQGALVLFAKNDCAFRSLSPRIVENAPARICVVRLPDDCVLEDAAFHAIRRLAGEESIHLRVTPEYAEWARRQEVPPPVHAISFDSGGLVAEQVEVLRQHKGLRSLYVCTQDDLSLLAGLDTLEEVGLHGAALNDDGALAQLPPLNGLERLDLTRAFVRGAGLAHLVKQPRLSALLLADGHRDFRSIPPRITDRDIATLSRLKRLTALALQSCDVTDMGAAELARLSQLEHLDLSHTLVTDKGLKHLAQLTDLRTLVLDDTRVTVAGLLQLKALPRLERLSVIAVGLSLLEQSELQQALPNVEIDFERE